MLPHGRHRQRRPHVPAPHVLRDARQLLDRRLLQAGRRRVRVGALARGLRVRPREDLGHGVRGRRGARPRPRRGGDRGVAVGRRPARADRPARRARRTSGRPARPAPAGRAASSTSTAGSSSAASRRPARRRQRALPRVLEPRVHAVRPGPGGRARRRCRRRTSTRAWASTGWRDPAGHDVGLRDRPVPAADRARRGAVRADLRRVRGDRPRAADPRRPHARHVVPRRRRRRAVERGPRLRAAPGDAPRDPAGPPDRDRARASCRASRTSCAS